MKVMNVVFLKEDEPVLLIYENLMFHCEKESMDGPGWKLGMEWKDSSLLMTK